MKKQIIALSFGLMTIGAFAQKKELKTAEKALKGKDYTAAATALSSLDALVDNMEAKYKAKYYFIKAQALAGKSNFKEAAATFNKLFAYEKEIGKIKYTKEAKPKLNILKEDVVKKAFNLYEKKDLKTASETFYTRYLIDKNDTLFLNNAANLALQSKDYDKSLKYYTELQKLGYTGIETQFLATNLATNKVENLGSKENRDLMVRLKKYIKPEDKTTKSKKNSIIKTVTEILIYQKKYDEAMLIINDARKENPNDLNLLLTQGDLYINLKQMDKFGDVMREAIELDPTNPKLFFNLGVVNANQNLTDEAIKYYKKAIELKPDYKDAYFNLSTVIINRRVPVIEEMNNNLSNDKVYASLELKLKEIYKEALPYLIKVDSLERDVDTVKNLLNVYDNLEMFDKADELRPIYKKLRDQ